MNPPHTRDLLSSENGNFHVPWNETTKRAAVSLKVKIRWILPMQPHSKLMMVALKALVMTLVTVSVCHHREFWSGCFKQSASKPRMHKFCCNSRWQ